MQRSVSTLLRSAQCVHRFPIISSAIQTPIQTSHIQYRGFAKRIHVEGETAAPKRKPTKSTTDESKSGRSGESLAALDAENELRLQPAVIEVMNWKPEPETRSEEELAAQWLFMKECSARLSRRRLCQNDAISRKMRRRWEALNALPYTIRKHCLLEDRTPLPTDLQLPRNCWGEHIVPEHGGLRGKQMLTAQEVKKIIHWEQRQKDRA